MASPFEGSDRTKVHNRDGVLHARLTAQCKATFWKGISESQYCKQHGLRFFAGKLDLARSQPGSNGKSKWLQDQILAVAVWVHKNSGASVCRVQDDKKQENQNLSRFRVPCFGECKP